jgi:hypothetical protein
MPRIVREPSLATIGESTRRITKPMPSSVPRLTVDWHVP